MRKLPEIAYGHSSRGHVTLRNSLFSLYFTYKLHVLGRKKISEEEKKRQARERQRLCRLRATDLKKRQVKEYNRDYNANKRKKYCELSDRERRGVRKNAKERMKKYRQRKREQELAAETDVGVVVSSVTSAVDLNDPSDPTLDDVAVPVAGPSTPRVTRTSMVLPLLINNQPDSPLGPPLPSPLIARSFSRILSSIQPSPPLSSSSTPLSSRNSRQCIAGRAIAKKNARSLKQRLKRLERKLKEEKNKNKKLLRRLKSLEGEKNNEAKKHNTSMRCALLRNKKSRYRCRILTKRSCKTMAQARLFFLRDNISRICPGKRETVTFKKVKMQKRYLLDTLKNVFKAFKREGHRISYSYFCKARPFYVRSPKVNDRRTCECEVHLNFRLKCLELWKKQVLPQYCTNAVERSACDITNKSCMYGECQQCINKLQLTMDPAELEDDLPNYHQWVKKTENRTIKNVIKSIKTVEKVKVQRKLHELADDFFCDLPNFKIHLYQILHQSKIIGALKDNLKLGEVVIHMDFAENYATKNDSEVQSMHFGASRRQISMHTSRVYVTSGAKSFVTISTHLDHAAHAIVAHLKPVFREIPKLMGYDVETVHFVSDGPSSQYKNRFILSVMPEILKQFFPYLKMMVWNYCVAGHGKGPCDGIGAAVKKRADGHVALGNDVTSCDSLLSLIKESQSSIHIEEVKWEDVEQSKLELDEFKKGDKLCKFKNISKKHQVAWTDAGFATFELSNYPGSYLICELLFL